MSQRIGTQRIGTGLLASAIGAVWVVKIMGMQGATPEKAQPLAWQQMPFFTLPKSDPLAVAVTDEYLKTWKTKGAAEVNQGIWMQSDMAVLTDHQGTVPLPAASLTKIATTLAALNKWGPDHLFETLVSATGPINNGVLEGDLVISGTGDPLFIWEEAIAVGNSLNQMGIRKVTGNLIIADNFYMNYQENPAISGQLLKQALNTSSWSWSITAAHQGMPPGTPKPQLEIAGEVKVATMPMSKTILLLRHQSLPLTQLLKEMNVYSNNAMADMLGKSVGGAEAVVELAAKSANVPQSEIQLINTSGLGMENRISPRAATAMLMAVERFLEPYQLSVADVFPVSGSDRHGTMLGRKIPLGTAIKTGTLRQVSALAGVMPTRDRGVVWFAIINRGGDIWGFRSQQDQMLENLSAKWGTAPVFKASTNGSSRLLGDTKRIETSVTN